jgi:hypothetical protein
VPDLQRRVANGKRIHDRVQQRCLAAFFGVPGGHSPRARTELTRIKRKPRVNW